LRGVKEADLKWAPLPKLEEVVDDPQMRAAGAFVDLDYPRYGPLKMVLPLLCPGIKQRHPLS
jgi:crotonobetainyl-CoA:carnitine CoA-transferase CaiB-like acyl-CoA transferase